MTEERRKPGTKLKPGPRRPSGDLVRASLTGVPGAGTYKGISGRCVHGHQLSPDPRLPGLQRCFTCARIRASKQYAAISAAAACLGMTFKECKATHGQGTARALQLRTECEERSARWLSGDDSTTA